MPSTPFPNLKKQPAGLLFISLYHKKHRFLEKRSRGRTFAGQGAAGDSLFLGRCFILFSAAGRPRAPALHGKKPPGTQPG